MLAAALEAEVDAYIAELAEVKDERGRRLVVRNGHHQPRDATTAAGTVEVQAPRVNDKRIDEETGRAQAVLLGDPAALGKEVPEDQRGVAASLPAWPLGRRLRTAVEQFLGSSAGLSPATLTRLTTQ